MFYFYFYAATILLLTTLLAINVSKVRIQEQIGNGDGGNKRLRRAIRSHGNTLEHALPYGLAILALSYLETSASVLAVMVFGFIATRIINSYSMLNSKFRLRQITAALSYIFEVTASIMIFIKII